MMNLIETVFNYLNENVEYAVLRNYEGLPYTLQSRDIDIIITHKKLRDDINNISRIINDSVYKLITLFRNDKMLTLICGSANKNGIDIIQFDFFFQTSCYGLILMEGNISLNSRENNGKIYHVNKECQFIDKYFYFKLLNISYPDKYIFLKRDMEDSKLLPDYLKGLIGCQSLKELENLSAKKFIIKKLIINLKRYPLKQITLFGSFLWYYMGNVLFYKGYSIGFSGPDGVGKTTVINAVMNELGMTYSSIKLFHFRPSLTPNLGDAAHQVKLKSTVDRNYSRPHRGKSTGKFNSFIRLIYYSFDYILGYFLKVRPQLKDRNIIIFDRYYTDIITDSSRSRIHLNRKFLYFFGQLFIPRLDYNFLLTADKNIIRLRKQELSEEKIEEISGKLNYLSKKKGYHLIVNNGDSQEAVREILNIIFEEQHKKSMKRLKKWMKKG